MKGRRSQKANHAFVVFKSVLRLIPIFAGLTLSVSKVRQLEARADCRNSISLTKSKHWRGFQRENGRKASPTLEFCYYSDFRTLQRRHRRVAVTTVLPFRIVVLPAAPMVFGAAIVLTVEPAGLDGSMMCVMRIVCRLANSCPTGRSPH